MGEIKLADDCSRFWANVCLGTNGVQVPAFEKCVSSQGGKGGMNRRLLNLYGRHVCKCVMMSVSNYRLDSTLDKSCLRSWVNSYYVRCQ